MIRSLCTRFGVTETSHNMKKSQLAKIFLSGRFCRLLTSLLTSVLDYNGWLNVHRNPSKHLPKTFCALTLKSHVVAVATEKSRATWASRGFIFPRVSLVQGVSCPSLALLPYPGRRAFISGCPGMSHDRVELHHLSHFQFRRRSNIV